MSTVMHTLVEQRRIIRQRTFGISGRNITLDVIASILAMLRSERATGRVSIDLSQGAPGSIQFEESAKIS